MLIPFAVLLCLGSSVTAKICESHTYWSSYHNKCEDCTICEHPDVVVRPCQGGKDTICGPLSDLNIDWSWMKHGKKSRGDEQKEMTETFKENMKEIRLHEMHVKEKENRLKKLHSRTPGILSEEIDDNSFTDEIFRTPSKEQIWKRLQAIGKERPGNKLAQDLIVPKEEKLLSEHPRVIQFPYDPETNHFSREEAEELLKSAPKLNSAANDKPYDENHLEFDDDGILIKKFGIYPVEDVEDLEEDTHQPEMESFTPTEKFILDWQTGILAMAVASCFIFFLVISCYFLSHLRHWKSIQTYLGKDAEELQVWLTPKKNSSPPLSSIYKATTEVIHKEGGHCKYLERIISKNAKKFNRVPGNVYQGAHPSLETSPLTAEDPNASKNISI